MALWRPLLAELMLFYKLWIYTNGGKYAERRHMGSSPPGRFLPRGPRNAPLVLERAAEAVIGLRPIRPRAERGTIRGLGLDETSLLHPQVAELVRRPRVGGPLTQERLIGLRGRVGPAERGERGGQIPQRARRPGVRAHDLRVLR